MYCYTKFPDQEPIAGKFSWQILLASQDRQRSRSLILQSQHVPATSAVRRPLAVAKAIRSSTRCVSVAWTLFGESPPTLADCHRDKGDVVSLVECWYRSCPRHRKFGSIRFVSLRTGKKIGGGCGGSVGYGVWHGVSGHIEED